MTEERTFYYQTLTRGKLQTSLTQGSETRMCLAPSLAFARARALARLHLSVVSKPLTNPVCIDTISDNLFSARCTSSLAARCKRRKMSMMAEKSEGLSGTCTGKGAGAGKGEKSRNTYGNPGLKDATPLALTLLSSTNSHRSAPGEASNHEPVAGIQLLMTD